MNDNKSSKFIFENLKVYQFSNKLAIELIKNAIKFPYQYCRIRDQLIGSAISVPLNIAEGSGRFSSKDKINFYRMARSSNYELLAIINICEELKLLSKNDWLNTISVISKMLTNLIKSENNKK